MQGLYVLRMWVSSIICTWCRRAPPLVFSQMGGAGQ